MKKYILTTLLLASAMMVNNSIADTQMSEKELALIKKVANNQLTLLNTFPGPGNLKGLILQSQEHQNIIMYIDKDAQYIIYGTVIDKSGTNLTQKDNELYIKKYTALKIADNLAETTSIKQGSDLAPYKIIVLADPNCSACHYSYQSMKPFIDKGELQVQWIFVYFVQADSQAKAAAIMAAEDPAKAMEENEAKFDMDSEEGGIPALEKIPDTIRDTLEGNMKFMRDTGINSTPTIIYYDKKGELKFTNGAPSDFANFLKNESPRVSK
ncbi:MAG: thiol:disulfide interchange protein DsbG [Gammaproteobacteria bacterium]|nr:thiol:disulfide interchange protein DsbG [Gammaproteobacteria bacterium]